MAMAVQKRFFHDKLVLLLLSVNSFLVALIALLVLLRIDGGKTTGYIVQYRSNLGLGAFKTGNSAELIAFVAFALLIYILHTALSRRIYSLRRHLSVGILALCSFLLVMAIIVSNALLVLR